MKRTHALVNAVSKKIILIVDKKGIFANGLSKKLKDEFTLVVISDYLQILEEDDSSIRRISHIPFWTTIPVIPNSTYSFIFVVYSLEVKSFLSEFRHKAQRDNATLILIVPVSLWDNTIIEGLTKEQGVRIVLVGDIFDTQTIFDTDTTIGRYFLQAQTTKALIVYGSATELTYPVFYEDAVEGILKVAFGKEFERLFFVFPKYPPTEISLAHMLQKVDPLLRVDFDRRQTQVSFFPVRDAEGEYVFGDSYPLQKRIGQTLSALSQKKLRVLGQNMHERPLTEIRENFYKKNPAWARAYFLGFLVFAFLLVLLPLIVAVVLSSVAALELKNAVLQVQAGELESAKTSIVFSRALFSVADKSYLFVQSEIGFLRLGNLGSSYGFSLHQGKEAAESARVVVDAAADFKRIFSGQSKNPKSDFYTALGGLRSAYAFLEKTQVSSFSAFTQYKSELARVSAALSPLISVSDVLPVLLGFEGEKTYLVEFQNNMELRPGGGFIGSYAMLNVKDGSIKKFTIYDVYDADGQLKGHVEPPFPIRRYIPQVHWYLRDSNFDMDFLRSASQGAYMLQKEVGTTVDGVIAVDVSFAKSLVEKFGSVYVADYNETVTKDNFSVLLQSHADKNSFPGSTQKKDFLRSLTNALFLKLTQEKRVPYFGLFEAVSDGISKKHILFAFSNPALQSVFTINNFSSTLWEEKAAGNTSNDFVGINEANLGVNKANLFVQRKLSQEMTMHTSGSVSGKLTINYENKSTSWPGGDYKNYLRIVLPQRCLVTKIIIDGQEQIIVPAITDPLVYEDQNFKPPKDLEVESYDEHGKTVYGFLTIVSQGGSKNVEAYYDLSQKAAVLEPAFSYKLWVFKQPGTEEDPYGFSLFYPDSIRVVKKSDGFKEENGVVRFSSTLDSDKHLSIEFGKK